MLLIADSPGHGAALTGRSAGWSPRETGPEERSLGLGAQAWACEVDDPFWRRLYLVREALRSQFDALRDWCAGGCRLPGPVAAVAGMGAGFHGHRGRPWEAFPGNLHLSVALSPAKLPAQQGIALTMLPAVATVEAVREMTGDRLRPGIKWVNDLLLPGGKVAGVLTATQSREEEMKAGILGVGLNVAATPAMAPTPFVPAATSLAAEGSEVTLPAALKALLTALGRRIEELRREGPEAMLEAYREASLVVGRRVRIWPEGLPAAARERWPPPLATGLVTAMNPDLSLRIEGVPEPVSRGRLAFEADCRALGR